MTKYFEYGVSLSEGPNLVKAIQTNSELTLRLKIINYKEVMN